MSEIETSYAVSKLKVDTFQIWPLIRKDIYFALIHKPKAVDESSSVLPKKTKRKLISVFKYLYGFTNFFRKYQYVFFTNTKNLRIVDGKPRDRLVFMLLDLLEHNESLVIERSYPLYPHPKGKRDESVLGVGFLSLFYWGRFMRSRKTHYHVSNVEILDSILEKYNIHFNLQQFLHKYFAFHDTVKKLLSRWKPKYVFITQYYGIFNQGIIAASKALNIPVIEFQHGLISDSHIAYNIPIPLNRYSFPDYLFVFGEESRKIFHENNYYIDQQSVFPIGNAYLYYLNNRYQFSRDLQQEIATFNRTYELIVAISSQNLVDDELFSFCVELAKLSPTILYIYVPRDMESFYYERSYPNNFIFLPDLNIYEIILIANVHATVYSTCALESLALNTPNILINIRNLAKDNLGGILPESSTNQYANSPDEFLKALTKINAVNRTSITKEHDRFFAVNYLSSLKQAWDSIQK